MKDQLSVRDLLATQTTKKSLPEEQVEKPFVVNLDDDLSEVFLAMAKQGNKQTLVKNTQQEVVGVITSGDALRLLARLLKRSEFSNLKLDSIHWDEVPEYMI